MSAKINQKSYLQKYLSGPSGDKKKKKKKISKGKGLKIVDDDIDLTKLRPLEGDELDILGEGEDAPQIAGIIDERPEEVKKLEQFKTSSKWRVINQDDGFNSKLQIEEIKRDVVEAQKENELVFGKMYSDSEDEDQNKKNDSDESPPREKTNSNTIQKSSEKPQNNSDSDLSPPRKSKKDSPIKSKMARRQENHIDSDSSPPRKNESLSGKTIERVRKPSRWGEKETRQRSTSPVRDRVLCDSDASPPRKSKESGKQSRVNKHNYDASQRTQELNFDSDASPPRKQKKNYDSSASKRDSKRNKSPDSDLSPPRKRKSSPERHDTSNRLQTGDKHRASNIQGNSSKQQSPDSDLSPPRKKPSTSRKKPPSPGRKPNTQGSDSDLSPPRKINSNDRYIRNDDSPPPSNKKMAERTLEGKMAGLSDAAQLRRENEAFRKREEDAFSKMADRHSGRNARPVVRRGKRETSEERRKLEEKAKRQKELDAKYQRWSKGLKQLEDREALVQQFAHEASKPLARHRDDRDLDAALRRAERSGDPMLQYCRQERRGVPEKPSYKGSFPPNRFNIRPGHRWDGVDRSNGYENKYFEQLSKRKAQEEDAYKWSTEDL